MDRRAEDDAVGLGGLGGKGVDPVIIAENAFPGPAARAAAGTSEDGLIADAYDLSLDALFFKGRGDL